MSYTPEQPNPVVFFIDRSLGKKTIADALKREGAEVYVHDDLFAADTEDESWLREVGKRKWVVLTKDLRIRYRTSERLAVKAANIAMFTLTARDCQGSEMADIFVEVLPRIIRFLKKNQDQLPLGLRLTNEQKDRGTPDTQRSAAPKPKTPSATAPIDSDKLGYPPPK